MTKGTLINNAKSAGFYQVTDSKQVPIQIQCPACNRQMMIFQKHRLNKKRILACTNGHRYCAAEKEYESLTGHCFICGKQDCVGSGHRFHGVIRAGMGL